MPRSTLSSLPVIAAMLLMPLPSEENTKNVSGGEYEAKAFWFSEFDSHAGGDDRAAIDTIAPAAQGQVELPTREFDLRENSKTRNPPTAGSSHRTDFVAAAAPNSCATMNPGASTGRLPVNASLAHRASATVGFATVLLAAETPAKAAQDLGAKDRGCTTAWSNRQMRMGLAF